MAQRFQHDKTDWKVIAEKLHLLGVRRVLLLGPVPQWKGSLPLIVAKNYPDGDYFIGEKYLDREIVKTNNKMKGVTTKWYEYIDIFDALCKDNNGLVCRARVDSGYTLMSMDYGHPTDDGSKFIANEIIKSYMPTDLLKAR